tara:strand:+ start:204 stop:305 length:102 start_codon:yes stop_codon:yes gene_type:complete
LEDISLTISAGINEHETLDRIGAKNVELELEIG